jgi:hypothetical protein
VGRVCWEEKMVCTALYPSHTAVNEPTKYWAFMILLILTFGSTSKCIYKPQKVTICIKGQDNRRVETTAPFMRFVRR